MILSAGAFQSPVLLMLSGIGPAEDLELYGIEVRENLPVGHNLQDHCMAQLNYETDEPSLFGAFTPENFELFEHEGRGPLTSNIPEAGGFFRTRPELDAPDIEFHYAPSMFYDEGLTAPHDQRLLLRPGRDQADEPRPRDAARAAGRLQAARAVQLPHDRGGPRAACSRACGWRSRSPSRSRCRQALRQPFSVPAGDSDEEIMDFVRRAAADRLSPDVDLRDRLGRRPGAARLRRRRPAGRRRVGDADDHAGEHERGDDHDRREGRRPDPRAHVPRLNE